MRLRITDMFRTGKLQKLRLPMVSNTGVIRGHLEYSRAVAVACEKSPLANARTHRPELRVKYFVFRLALA